MSFIIKSNRDIKYDLECQFGVTISYSAEFEKVFINTLSNSVHLSILDDITENVGKSFTYDGEDYILDLT